MSFVEILSGIRLNLASFEQFVSIACSLADDNPAIKRGIYEATKEIRSSAQLIDHLRSLFNHQQATELERRQHQLFAQSNSSAAAANYKLATGYHYDRNQQQWPPSSYNYNRQQQQQHNFGAQVEDNNLKYFTYTNQLALIRASKCLVANVAKILYLTDEIVLKGSAQQAESQQQQQQQQQQQRSSTSPTSSQHHRIQEPVASDLNQRANLSDRLDNVANYSQLLRSFSELSCDLVDLGYRIMAARKSRQLAAAAAAAASKRDLSNNCRSKQPMPTPSPWPSATATATTTTHYDPMYDPMSGRRATSERQTERTSSSVVCYPSSTSYRNANANFANSSSVNIDTAHEQQQHRQVAPPPTMRQQTMTIRPSSSMLFASTLPGGGGLTSAAVGLGSDSFGLTQDTHRGSLGGGGGGPMRPPLVAGGQQLLDSATSDMSAHTVLQAEQSQRQQALAGGSFAHQDLDQSQLAAQIQDMQVLFQVNRLIIDRSILLLLSASKCCLGQGSERHYGLEARYSIGVQIRVSISIIMALVKCSVFGLYAPCPREPSSPSTTPTPPPPITLPTFGANCQQQQSTTTTFDGAQFVSGGGGSKQQQQQPPLACGGSSAIQAAAAAQLPLGAINDNNIGRNELQPFGQQRQHSSVASKRLLDGGELGGVQFTENSNNRQQAHRYDRPQANYLGAKFNRDDHQQRSLWLNLDNSSYWADAATSTTGGGSAWLNYANNQFVAPTLAPGLANIASQQPTVPAATIVPTEPASFCNYLAPDEQTNMSKADQQKKQQQQQYYNSMAQYYNGQAVLYDELISQHLAEEDAQLFSVGPGRVFNQQRNARRGPLAVATDQQLHQQQHPFRVSTLETGHLGGGRGGRETGLGTATGAKLAMRSNTTAAATTTTTTKQFDIVNYFLLTASGTPSAHDALHGLQLLVEPFERVSNQDELAGELDEALVFVASGHFYRLAKQRQLLLRQPASLSSPKSAVAATVTGSSKTNYIQSPQDVHYLASQDRPAELGLGEPQQLTGGGLASELSEQRRQQAAAAAVVQQFGYANSHQALRHASATPVAASMSLTGAAVDKENQDPAANSSQQDQLRATRMAATNCYATANQQVMELLEQQDLARPVALMNKRQLVKALNLTFLGEVKSNLVKGVHEFTDCAYTKHESRETILSLLAYVKFQLNKFVRLIYRLRRRSGSLNEPNQLALLRQIACQLVDACAELDNELKTVAVEQSDELDRCSTNLNLIKKLKHHCLVGDVAKERAVSSQFASLPIS